MQISDELQSYKEFIKSLAIERDEKMFVNSGLEHAEVVLSTIFDFSSDTIRIFANSLTSPLAKRDNYIGSLNRFLKKEDTKLLILVQENKLHENIKLLNILSYNQYLYPSKVQIKKSYCSLRNTKTDKNIHFTIGDSSIFRLEEDIDNYKAFGSFNAETFSSALIQKFDSIFSSPRNEVLDLA